MDASHENYRFYLYAERKRGQKPQQILQQLSAAFGDSAPVQSFVYKWFMEFESGNRVSVHHLPNPGRPLSKCTTANISRVYAHITEDPKSTVADISESVHL